MRAIYKPKGRAGEYAKYACNFYTGCSNDCVYCYCKRGVMAHVWDDKPHLRKCFNSEYHALKSFMLDITKNEDELKDGGIFFSFTTDPCLPETVELTMKALVSALTLDIPCFILTKCVSPILEIGLKTLPYEGFADKVAVGYTLTGHDELEPNASPNSERIAAMKRIHDMGIKTFASIEPIIDFPHAREMMRQTFCFCDLYKVGLRSGVKKSYYKDDEIRDFFWWLYGLEGGQKVYLKDSFFDRLPASYGSRECLKGKTPFVGSDYNIFKGE